MGYGYLQEVILVTSVDPTNLLYLLPVNITAFTVINTGHKVTAAHTYGIFINTLGVNLLSILSFFLDQKICFDYRPYFSNKRLIL